MKTIVIDGIIGWDVSAKDVRQQILEANGDDITFEINSPGGLVTEGLAIHNAIKTAQGKTTAIITGMAASMASYIFLAANSRKTHKNSIYLIHNPQGEVQGDHHAMRKSADVLESLAGLVSSEYAKKTGKTEKEIKKMMDIESIFIGEEILNTGFANELIQEDSAFNTTVALLKEKMKVANEIIEKFSDATELDKIAACIGVLPTPTAQTELEKPKGEKDTMEQYELGVQAERKRVADIKAFAGRNAEADKAVEEAIASGKQISECMAQLVAAVASGKQTQDNDNPPTIVTVAPTTASGAMALSDDEKQAMQIFNLSIEDMKAYKKAGI